MKPEGLDEAFRHLHEEGFVRTLIERVPAILYIDATEGVSDTLYMSPQTEEILGFTAGEWIRDQSLWERQIHPDDVEYAVGEVTRTNESGEPYEAEYRMMAKDGRIVWIHDEAILIRDDDGAPKYWQGVMLDITGQKEAERKLGDTEEQFKALVEHIPAMLYIDPPDERARTVYVSPQIQQILGVSPEEWIADEDFWHEHLHPEDRDRASAEYRQFLETGHPEVTNYRMIRPDGRVVWIHDRSAILRDADGKVRMVQGAMFDATEQHEAEQQLAFMAHHDRLTGLPNRPMFEEMADLALARARRNETAVAVLLMDLDDFKLVNDSLGHAAGDEMLRQLALRLREAVGDTDLVARQGGDEFLVLISDLEGTGRVPGPDMDAALLAAESAVTRIVEALGTPFLVTAREVYVTASIGIAIFPSYAADARALLQHADTAMYRTKQNGPGGHAVYSADAADPMNRLSFTTRLRKAVDSRHWVLHYQPIVNLETTEMTGVEALLRWQDPTGGLIPPGEFIPLAEEMGLIETIGDWVIEEVARQSAEWRDAGLDLEIGLNLSPRQVWQPDLSDKIFGHLEAAGIDPGSIMLEVTESTAMTDPERTQHILWELHGRGLRLAIDDFGTGYSSLSRLKHLPVSILKVDRAFVMDVPGDSDASSMVSAVIGLAESLGMLPLAEGIETAEQWKFLKERGCGLGQGYFFSRPVPADEIPALARDGMRLTDDITT